MEKSTAQADFQLMDNYISEFSLTVLNKIKDKKELGINANIGFRIVHINEKDMIGQIELKYEVDVMDEDKQNATIILVMNALFQGNQNMEKEEFEQMLKINGATTLSHLCRAYITSTTALSGMPPINMPLINFYEFFKMAERKNEE